MALGSGTKSQRGLKPSSRRHLLLAYVTNIISPQHWCNIILNLQLRKRAPEGHRFVQRPPAALWESWDPNPCVILSPSPLLPSFMTLNLHLMIRMQMAPGSISIPLTTTPGWRAPAVSALPLGGARDTLPCRTSCSLEECCSSLRR